MFQIDLRKSLSLEKSKPMYHGYRLSVIVKAKELNDMLNGKARIVLLTV